MNSLFQDLMTASYYAKNPELFYSQPKSKQIPKSKLLGVMASMEKNKNKNCTTKGCGRPRYISPSGIIRGTKCKICSREARVIAWARYAKNLSTPCI